MRNIFGISVLLLLVPFQVSAVVDIDAGVQPGSIAFSEQQLYAGEQVRMYATIVNPGAKDVRGIAQFYQGAIALGEPRPFSVKAQSVPAYIWTDWRPSEGTYNISVSIVGTEPDDQNTSNNMGVTPLMTITKRPPPPPPPPTPSAAPASSPNQASTQPPASAPSAKAAPFKTTSESQAQHFIDLVREDAKKIAPQTTKKAVRKLVQKDSAPARSEEANTGTAPSAPEIDELIEAEAPASAAVDPSKPVPFPKIDPVVREEESPREKSRGGGILLALAASAGASMLIAGVLWSVAKDK